MKIKPSHVLLAMATLYVCNTVFGWVYASWPYADIPMHIMGGFLAALLALTTWKELVTRYKIKNVPPFVVVIGVIGFTALIAILWECHELLLDQWHARLNLSFSAMQPSNADTMKDLANGIFGACLMVLIFLKEII